jgi:ABC-type polysaccharide/polyol phosphate transport system ATPase subunit
MSASAPTSAAGQVVGTPPGPVALAVDAVRKDFRLPHEQVNTLKERVLHPFRKQTFEQLHALDGVSFEVGQGEFFGVVGRNGSGKSTLLRCLAGIYDVDAGDIAIAGRVSPFIELGVGFNPELTARDNVIINALMLGMTRAEAEDAFDEVIAFAELERFLELKLKNYSSGMQVRLGFSVAVQARTEVLLVDEVLAVGDAAFQQKCYEQFHLMKDEGRTVVFVTHDMAAVQRFCDRALLLDRGRVVDVGLPDPIARQYNELNFGRRPGTGPEDDRPSAPASRGGAPQILATWFEDWRGVSVDALAQGERCRIGMRVRFGAAQDDPIFAVALQNEAHHTVLAMATNARHGETGAFAAGEEATVYFQFENHLAGARYRATSSVARNGSGADVLDRHEEGAELVVHATVTSGGFVDLPHQVEIARH